jgi:hypothetical protein
MATRRHRGGAKTKNPSHPNAVAHSYDPGLDKAFDQRRSLKARTAKKRQLAKKVPLKLRKYVMRGTLN